MQESASNFTPKIGVDWNKTITFGVNNPKSEVLSYTFDMVDFKVARLSLTDANKRRFSVPEEVLNKPPTNKNMRLDMVGFTLHNDDPKQPFAFSFRDNLDPNNVFLDTRGQNLIFSDKYIQMDILLPS